MQLLKYRRLLIRMLILLGCFLAVILYQSSKAQSSASNTTISEIKIQQVGEDEITIQIRTSDGKPVQFKMTTTNESVSYNINVIHSKITPVKNIKKGDYNYQCLVKDQVVLTGKFKMK